MGNSAKSLFWSRRTIFDNIVKVTVPKKLCRPKWNNFIESFIRSLLYSDNFSGQVDCSFDDLPKQLANSGKKYAGGLQRLGLFSRFCNLPKNINLSRHSQSSFDKYCSRFLIYLKVIF